MIMAEVRKINLIVRNKTAYVWNSDDWKIMRHHRVVGSFAGNVAALPRQDFHEGLPLVLLREEATLLVEKGLAQFKEIPSLSQLPSEELRERSRTFRDEILSQQARESCMVLFVELLKDSRKKEILKNIKEIVAGKRNKRKICARSDSPVTDINEEQLEREILEEEWAKVQDPKQSSLSIQIFCGDPWVQPEDFINYNWQYPLTDDEKLQYYTYKDLWEKGYYITSGRKFGANYLIYPGEPVKYHSFFIVVCVDRNRLLRPAEMISYGRLGQSVRKTFVMAYLDDDYKVNYQSIQWTGN